MMYGLFILSTALLIRLSFASFSVDTPPSATVCQTIQLSWQGGIEPWLLSIVDASSPNPAIDNLGTATDDSFSWTVEPDDLNNGNSVILQVVDSTGDSGQSSPFTIQPGTTLNGHCLQGANTAPQPISGGATTNSSPDSGSTGNSGAGNTSTTDGDGSGGTDTSNPDTSSTGGTGLANTAGNVNLGGGGSGTSSSSSRVESTDGGGTTTSHPGGQESSSNPLAPTSPSITNSPSNPSTTSISFLETQSSGLFSPTVNSGTGLQTSAPNSALNPLTPGLSDPTGGPAGGGAALTATDGLPFNSLSSTAPGQSGASSNAGFSKKNVMSGSIIGGVIAAVLCVLVAMFCVIRRCRRRRSDVSDRLAYPFAMDDTAAVPREMVGRSGHPASAFSSWGNHGDLADERALSPTEGHQLWEPGQGTIESRYQATFVPGHMASASSIDRNDPTSQQRFRSPIPNSMTNYHAEPSESSAAILGEQLDSPVFNDGNPVPNFYEVPPQEMPSWTTVHGVMGRHSVIGHPPPYTSN